MGGGGQSNKGQATQAANQQTAASQQDMALSAQNAATQKQMLSKLFGTGSGGNEGSLGGMLDPSKLNDANLSGAYKSAYNQGTNQLSKDYANQKGSLAQAWANKGMTSGSTPSGFQADQERQLGSSEADARGQAFTGALGTQHQEALNNFWNAGNIASGQAATAGGNALQGAANSGNSSAQIYGTAGQYHPSPFGSVMGSALQAGGAVGAGAASHCPCIGSLILMAEGTERAVELLRKGDKIRGVDGTICTVEQISTHLEPALYIKTSDGCVASGSLSHAFVTGRDGFVIAFESFGSSVLTKHGHGAKQIVEIGLLGRRQVFDILTDGSHSYRADGVWAWGVRDEASDAYLALKDTSDRLLKVGQWV